VKEAMVMTIKAVQKGRRRWEERNGAREGRWLSVRGLEERGWRREGGWTKKYEDCHLNKGTEGIHFLLPKRLLRKSEKRRPGGLLALFLTFL